MVAEVRLESGREAAVAVAVELLLRSLERGDSGTVFRSGAMILGAQRENEGQRQRSEQRKCRSWRSAKA